MRIRITWKEWVLVGLIALLGIVLSTHTVLAWLNSLSPLLGYLVYIGFLYLMLYALSLGGIVIWKRKISHPLQVLGAMLVSYAFFLTVDFTSPLTQFLASGTWPAPGTSTIYFQTSDGLLFYVFHDVLGVVAPSLLRWLIYVISPTVAALIGVALVSRIELKS